MSGPVDVWDNVTVITIDSCHSRWVFDSERRRFRRIPKGLGSDPEPVTTDWRPYYLLHVDDDSAEDILKAGGDSKLLG